MNIDKHRELFKELQLSENMGHDLIFDQFANKSCHLINIDSKNVKACGDYAELAKTQIPEFNFVCLKTSLFEVIKQFVTSRRYEKLLGISLDSASF